MTMFKSLFRKFVKAPGRTASKSDLMSHPPVQVKTDPPERKGKNKVPLGKAASVVKMGRNQLVTFGFLVLIVSLIGMRGSREIVRFHFELGRLFSSQGNWDKAINEYRKAIHLERDYVNARYALGLALTAKGGWDAAIVEYREALRLDPSSGKAHYALGLSLGANGDLDNAGNEYTKALTLQPDLEEVRSNLRNVLREDPDPEGTVRERAKAVPLVRQLAAAHNNLGIAP